MLNLNECKFGDRLMTKGGDMILFLYRSYINRNTVVCSIKTSDFSTREIKYHSNGKRYHTNEPSELDIIGKWEGDK